MLPDVLRTIAPRQRSTADSEPAKGGNVTVASIGVRGFRTWTPLNNTPDRLMLDVRPSCQTAVPASRYRNGSPTV